MTRKRERMGRPPARWVYEILNLKLADNHWLDKNELAKELGKEVNSVKSFLKKLDMPKKYEFDDGFIRAKTKFVDLKKAVAAYIAPWPLDTMNS